MRSTQMQRRALPQHQSTQPHQQLRHPLSQCRRSHSASVAARAAAEAAAQGCSCRHTLHQIKRLRQAGDALRIVLASVLVTDTFSTPAAGPPLDLFSNAAYFVRAVMQQLSLHVLPGNEHLTFLLTAPSHQLYGDQSSGSSGSSSSSSSDVGSTDGISIRATTLADTRTQQYQYNHHQQQEEDAAGSSSMTEPGVHGPFPEVPIGVVNITLQAAPRPVAETLQVAEGSPVAMVTNLVVARPFRRQGLARQLMVAAEGAVRQQQLDPPPDHIILLAYKDYQPAVGLYNSLGYHTTGWVDPLWLKDAEAGRLRQKRRILMAKRLRQ